MENNVNKPLQNSDKTVKNSKKIPENNRKNNPKKADKGLIIGIVLCISIVIFIIGILTLPEPVIAAIQLNKTENFIADSDNFTVVINAPMESTGILNDKEAVIRDDDANAFVEKLTFVLENVKYCDTKNVNTGIWKTKIVLYNATDEIRIYTDPDRVYIENNGKLISYSIGEKASSTYSQLYSDIEGLLN